MSDKYALIAAEKADPTSTYPVVSMCSWLAVSAAGFYEWATAVPGARARRRELVTLHVRAAFTAGRGAYGVRRVHAILTRCVEPSVASASLHLVRSIMREHDLVACQPRAYRTTTERDDQAEPAIADHLHRDFTAEAPGTKLVGDITSWESQRVVTRSAA